MRLRLLLLGFSLAANTLLFTHWRRISDASSRPIISTPSAPSRSAAGPMDPTAHIDPETWTALAPEGELTDFVARLRAQGYPPDLLRAIVQAHLRDRFADRLRPLLEAAAAQPYWRGGSGSPISPKITIARRALEREMNDLTLQLLGPPAQDPADVASRRRRYGDLAPEKIAALRRLNADYFDLRHQVNLESREIVLPDDREKLVFLEKERRADLARLLTAEELADFDLRTGRASNHLRYQLAVFEPTEQEFRAIHLLYQTLEAQFGPQESMPPDVRRQRAAAEKALAPQIEAVLGADRFADYQRTTAPGWVEAHQAVSQLNLPPATIGPLVAIQQDLMQRAQTLRTDRTLAPAERDRRLNGLEQEAITRLTPVLGARLADYQANGGYWLYSLRPPPPPLTPAP
jgi:hypothetical protein